MSAPLRRVRPPSFGLLATMVPGLGERHASSVTARVRRRIEALLVRRGIATGETDEGADPLADESAALAGLTAVAVRAGDRAGLERLARYVFRPPLGQHRLRHLPDGRIAVALQREWADGTTHLVFQPGELLERLATLVPRPRDNLLICHGVLAPNGKWRRAIVPDSPPVSSPHVDADESRSAAPAGQPGEP